MSKTSDFRPGPRIPSVPADIIVNANAPIIEIKIVLDCRFHPAKLQLMAPSNMPESVVMKALNDAIGNLLVRQISKDMTTTQLPCPHPGVFRGEKCNVCGRIAGEEILPTLPPAPEKS